MIRELGIEDFEALVGVEQEPSDWLLVDQARIDAFADATGDHQFIHVDPGEAAKTPFGGTIAHGFLTLSLLSYFSLREGLAPKGTKMAINYGLNRLRFLNPVKVDSRVRVHSRIEAVERKAGKGLMVTRRVEIEIEGETRPALVAETITLYMMEV